MGESGRREESRRWISQAKYDLKAAAWNLEGGFYNTVCFLAQQSAEKALKSLLYYGGTSRTKLMTHSTVQLVREAASFVASLESLVDDARELDLHYIPSRYPNGLPGGFPHSFYGEKTARAALQCAERIINEVLDFYLAEGFSLAAQE
jgi:HEPN domain-containing protein